MDKQEITRYIGQHSAWKSRLKQAIDSGQHTWNVPEIRSDDHCDFGKWLKTLPPAVRSNEHYRNVTSLHADFHREAAHILELVDAGKKDQAGKAMELRGSFTAASTKLTHEMTEWRESI